MSQAGKVIDDSGTGDVVGPGSSTDNAVARWDGTTGKLLQNSVAILNDAGALSGLTQLDVDNIRLNGNSITSTDANGYLIIQPNGTGQIYLVTNQTVVFGGLLLPNASPQTTDFTATPDFFCWLVDTTSTAITAQLDNAPTAGQVYIFKDATGTAATRNITVSGTVSGKNIDGGTTSVINVNYGSLTLYYNGIKWNVI